MMMPYHQPPHAPHHPHYQSRRYQRHPTDIYDAEHGINGHTGGENHVAAHRHHPEWSWGNHSFVDLPQTITNSFSSHSSGYSGHHGGQESAWAHFNPPHNPFQQQYQHRRPPPPPVVYTRPNQSQAAHKSVDHRKPASLEYIYDLRDTDVLCGRGAPSNFHGGNRFFKELVNQYQSSYLAARRTDKPEIANEIVNHVQERGGRFLKRVKLQGRGPAGHFCWQEIGQQRAYEKACQALREGAPELRRKLAAREIAAAALCLDRLNSRSEDSSSGREARDEHDDATARFNNTSDFRE